MLVLSRKVGQRIYIGDDIVITVLEIRPATTGARSGWALRYRVT